MPDGPKFTPLDLGWPLILRLEKRLLRARPCEIIVNWDYRVTDHTRTEVLGEVRDEKEAAWVVDWDMASVVGSFDPLGLLCLYRSCHGAPERRDESVPSLHHLQ
jgi:hypothetical protein